MEIHGYKCFNKNLTNRYKTKFKVGKTYTLSGIIKFGNDGNGYHMCKRLEDTLRFFDAKNNEIVICEVVGKDEIVEYYDEYNGYYDMYSVRTIEIIKKLTREEIINIMLNTYEERIIRFISLYKLNKLEIDLFKEKYQSNDTIIKFIEYYQEQNLDVFKNKKKILQIKRID